MIRINLASVFVDDQDAGTSPSSPAGPDRLRSHGACDLRGRRRAARRDRRGTRIESAGGGHRGVPPIASTS